MDRNLAGRDQPQWLFLENTIFSRHDGIRRLEIQATGSIFAIAEIGEQLAWLGPLSVQHRPIRGWQHAGRRWYGPRTATAIHTMRINQRGGPSIRLGLTSARAILLLCRGPWEYQEAVGAGCSGTRSSWAATLFLDTKVRCW